MALIGLRHERLLAPVNGNLETHKERQRGAFVGRELPDGENVVWADAHAIFLALTAMRIHDWRDDARRLLAGRCVRCRHRVACENYRFSSRIAVSRPPKVSGYIRPDRIW